MLKRKGTILALATILSSCAAITAFAAPVNLSNEGVHIMATTPGSPGRSSSRGSSNNKPLEETKCMTATGAPVPCSSPLGRWSQSEECYMSELMPQPPKNDPVWQGHTEGVVMVCRFIAQFCVADGCYTGYPIWFPSAEMASIDPAVLAQTAVEQLKLQPIDIGMVPYPLEKDPGSVGVVGQSVWLWVQNPTESTWGPITKTATAGSASVTATARVEKVVWDMGDGSKVTCKTPGTAWNRPGGRRNGASPDCGYNYQKQGDYAVSATTHWHISWAGMGQSGTFDLTRTTTVHNVIGEIQVLGVNPKK